MKQIMAIYNAARWMVYCPFHGSEGAVLALNYYEVDREQSKFWTENNEYICPRCYPGSLAQMTVMQGRRIITIPDQSARRTARMAAQQNDEIYQVVFPDEREQIEAINAERPRLMRHWQPGETLEFLENENKIILEMLKS